MEYISEIATAFFLVVFSITFIVSYNELKSILKKKDNKFENIIEDLSTSIAEIKDKENRAIEQRNLLNSSITVVSGHQTELIVSVDTLNNEVSELSEKIKKMEYKIGSDIDSIVDSYLVDLVVLTPYEDLKLYLNQKRTIMVQAAKRLIRMDKSKINVNVIKNSWESMRSLLYDCAIKISPEFNDYIQHSIPFREEKRSRFESSLINALIHGNGTKNQIFIEQITKYIKSQLEFTFTDYQNYRSKCIMQYKTEKNQNMTDYLHILVRENKLEDVFYQLQKIIENQKNNELMNRLTLLISRYSSYKKDVETNVSAEECNANYLQITKSTLLLIDSVKNVYF